MPSQALGKGELADVLEGTRERMGDFEYSTGAGFGGEMLAGAGMDTVSDGLKGADGQQGLSAATILSLLEEGSFDYDSLFTDQAAFPIEFDDTRPRGERGE